MRVCQLCGCASWGPVHEGLGALATQMRVSAEHVECDNCHALARKDLVEDSLAEVSVMTNRINPYPGLTEFLNHPSSSAAPETRMGRLVHAIVMSQEGEWTSIRDRAVYAVNLAREIEYQMDVPNEPAQSLGGIYASFRWQKGICRFDSRESLQQWLIHGFGQAKREVSLENKPYDMNINRFAKHFIDWIEKGAPTE